MTKKDSQHSRQLQKRRLRNRNLDKNLGPGRDPGFFLFWEENKLTFALFRVKVVLNRGGRASSFIYLLYRELQEVGVQHDRGEANGLLRAS